MTTTATSAGTRLENWKLHLTQFSSLAASLESPLISWWGGSSQDSPSTHKALDTPATVLETPTPAPATPLDALEKLSGTGPFRQSRAPFSIEASPAAEPAAAVEAGGAKPSGTFAPPGRLNGRFPVDSQGKVTLTGDRTIMVGCRASRLPLGSVRQNGDCGKKKRQLRLDLPPMMETCDAPTIEIVNTQSSESQFSFCTLTPGTATSPGQGERNLFSGGCVAAPGWAAGWADPANGPSPIIVEGKLDEFKVEGILGSGESSHVYKGTDSNSGKRVALKLTHAKGSEAKRQIEQEFELLRQMQHPHIVRVLDLRTAPSGPVMVSEYVTGDSLEKDVIEAKLPVKMKTVRLLAEQLTNVLAYLETKRIVHRDVKPANVMVDNLRLEEAGVTPKAVLLDFGVAKVHNSGDIMLSNTGTVGYRSPEMLLGWVYSHPVDVWGLGATITAMVTGRNFARTFDYKMLNKYEGRGMQDVLEAEKRDPSRVHLAERLPAATRRARWEQTIPPLCVDFLERCISVMPQERSTASELLEHEWLGDKYVI
jgi:predicted Ser/Thr protein kinase